MIEGNGVGVILQGLDLDLFAAELAVQDHVPQLPHLLGHLCLIPFLQLHLYLVALALDVPDGWGDIGEHFGEKVLVFGLKLVQIQCDGHKNSFLERIRPRQEPPVPAMFV